jgi:hypothetical protein
LLGHVGSGTSPAGSLPKLFEPSGVFASGVIFPELASNFVDIVLV